MYVLNILQIVAKKAKLAPTKKSADYEAEIGSSNTKWWCTAELKKQIREKDAVIHKQVLEVCVMIMIDYRWRIWKENVIIIIKN